jgi:uncharacterized protein (DUF433 family)
MVARHFTPSEAAHVSGVTLKRVHNAIDKHIVAVEGERVDYAPRFVTDKQVLLLKLWAEVGDYLNDERRARLLEALDDEPSLTRFKIHPLVTLELAPARKEIETRARELDAAGAIVEKRRSVLRGEPVFKGTRIPVRLVADMLADGASVDEVVEDYPRLDARTIELGRIWAAAHPRRGRPRSLVERGAKLVGEKRVASKRAPA